MATYVFVPSWGLALLAGVALVLLAATAFLSKRLVVLEETADDLQERRIGPDAALLEE